VFPGGGLGGCGGDVGGVEDEERLFGRQFGDCHVEEFAVAQSAFPHRPLGAVGDGLDDLRRAPFGQRGELVGGGLGAGEGRDVSVGAACGGAFLYQQVPHADADRLLGLVDSGAHR